MGISAFFVHRPIFAWVLAIVTMLAGAGAIMKLPVSQYPDVAPPSVVISASYPGASAETVQSSVTQVIEQQLSGLDGMLYFSSSSNSAGQAKITVTFAKGTDPDIAQVQVQDKVQQANSQLPTEVQAQGLTITKANADFLLAVGVYDGTDKSTSSDVADFIVSHFQDPISRITGVGQYTVFGSQYAMRIWLDPAKLAANQLMPSDVESAVTAQNIDLSSGQLGQNPAPSAQMLNAVVMSKSRLQTPEQFANIVVKANTDGSVVHLHDVARIELGSQDYSISANYNRHPASGIAVQLAPGADALKTIGLVKAEVDKLQSQLPAGYHAFYARDTSTFVKLSIEEVVKTLIIAIILVVIVMYVFLQSWRATLVPAIAVPVVLLGTFAVLYAVGYSINTMTLFGMVLAIGLLVDDAIVVVENVERIMEHEGLSPFDATIKSMGEIGSALVGIALVLSAVLLPMAFFGGSTGVIYRQFSVTIVASMVLSVITALVLSPALCATILKPATRPGADGHAAERAPRREGWRGRIDDVMVRVDGWMAGFNRWFDRLTKRYVKATDRVIHRRGVFLIAYGAVVVVVVVLFTHLSTGFLPTEDQGQIMLQYQLPPGATTARTNAVRQVVQDDVLNGETKAVSGMFAISGFNFSGQAQNAGLGFSALKSFDQRGDSDLSASAIAQRLNMAFSKIRDATAYVFLPPAVSGLGQSDGFTFELLNSSNMPEDQFKQVRDKLLMAAMKDPKLAQVRLASLPDTPQLKVDFDDDKLAALGLSDSDATNTLSSAWGSTYIDNFVDRGRVKQVYMQGDAPSRMLPQDLDKWYVRATSATGADGTSTMVPFSSFTSMHWQTGSNTLTRFNGVGAWEFDGQAAPGLSSGDAMNEIVALQEKVAPGTSYAWSSLSYQEQQSTGQALPLYAISILVVFLSLAALYESWSVPFAVLLVIPLGVIGAVLAVTLRGLDNNIYFQVGLLTTIGLSAKNAILIVEFAEAARREGKDPMSAALEAARIRLRPILMTSIAFVAGVFPLAVATGAGAQSRINIGTAVLGGMLTATALAIFYVPLFFLMVGQLFHRNDSQAPATPEETA